MVPTTRSTWLPLWSYSYLYRFVWRIVLRHQLAVFRRHYVLFVIELPDHTSL